MATVLDQSYEQVSLDKVHPHPDNPRKGDVDALEQSIEVNGFYGALVVQRSTGNILVGNHRYMAAKKAGIEQLPALVIDVDDEAAARILLVDNRATELATWDEEALHAMLTDLAMTDQELAGTLYSNEDLEDLLMDSSDQPRGDGSMLAKADVTLGPPKHTVAEGDVWQLGPHMLICADVLTGWPAWVSHLAAGVAGELVFAPYPSPFLPFSTKLEGRRLLLVQPNVYLAGHLLDKWHALTDTEPMRAE